MRTLCLCLLVGVLATVSAQDARLQDDAALQKQINLRMSLAALEEVLQEVSRQTGVSLRCQDALREVKVSVFVENGVAATLLENLAKL
ncbi:MAG: hypothetical protein NZ556_04910, partial [Fimbriimonadales bacterium]|nr:hypothetical protein [Fimbriimonadales bacterium]